ncbi:cobalt-precorrin-5B (C(1))-methyltransferase CbiD [Anoxynatronum buryatiense]|uniref:Cobalt-precorrin-5B C(1)-methyltransferase n=1 Tax=Anoxynatronum buryatiense TaxID=489973 RepID=A0AA46AJ11_9CLOT|nr:cobalt-precorrin-5B (C(1))-methyltransferase CbiD [Anoxynatronum buryatiense]SMP56348.1 cobalt-precorrin 5B C1-methyltransferase [Anoxynatronum buryatiense]
MSRPKNPAYLRKGYTTGACAAAAAAGAAAMLRDQQCYDSWTLELQGKPHTFRLEDPQVHPQWAACRVVKDAGDDPDITNGVSVHARVALEAQNPQNPQNLQNPQEAEKTPGIPEIILVAGEGVGTVTRPGLPVPVGQPAINDAPRQMILANVKQVLEDHTAPQGRLISDTHHRYTVTISIPGGEALAKRTYNPKLGVVGGLSILGTTGIVEPMSQEAWVRTLELECRMLAAAGHHRWLVVPGSHGQAFLRDQLMIHPATDPSPVIRMGNFPGTLFDEAATLGVKEVLLVGHVAKLVKIAGGIFHLHSRVADARREILAANLLLYGAGTSLMKQVMHSNTAEEAAGIIQAAGEKAFFDFLAHRISQAAAERTDDQVQVGTILFSYENGLLGRCPQGRRQQEQWKRQEDAP